MATVCAASQTVALPAAFVTGSASTGRLKPSAASAVPLRQKQNGSLKVSASSEERCSRREAMTVVGGAGLAGLLFLLPVGSAEAGVNGLPRVKPESRRKIREELEKIKEQTVKLTEEATKNVQGAAKEVGGKLANK